MSSAVTNGTVKTCAAGPSGRSATVHDDNPPPAGHDETYTDLAQDVYETLLAAFAGNTKIDTTVGADGKCNGATAHR